VVTLDDIRAARERIAGRIYHSPTPANEFLTDLTGAPVLLKLENLQRTGSFKERGAANRILVLTPEERARGLITASAGNHAQAVAYHATSQGIRSRIVMPEGTPLIKVSNTRAYGAEVVLHGASFDEAFAEARRQCDAEGWTFLHGFDDPWVVAGAGTAGLEIVEDVPGVEAVVVPVGGGGLISGIACAVKELKPGVRVVGVQTERVPSMIEARRQGEPVTVPAARTIADGIGVRRVGALNLAMCARYVDEIVTVDEEEIASAILMLLEREKTVAEGAGAAGVAAVMHGKVELGGARTVISVGGGNIDVTMLARIIERGLHKDGRMVRLRVQVSDHPGELHRLTGIVTHYRANIVQVDHERAYYGVALGHTSIDLTLETRGRDHIAELRAGLAAAGYNEIEVV